MSLQRVDQIDKIMADTQTGEVLYSGSEIKTTTIHKGISEDKFIKIYYNTYLAAMDWNTSDITEVLIAIGKRMTYSSEGQLIILPAPIKEDMAREIGKTTRHVEKVVKLLCEKGMLKRTGGPRSATYYVSPFIIAKGKWNSVQKLRLEYSKIDGTILLESGIDPDQLPVAQDENEQISAYDLIKED